MARLSKLEAVAIRSRLHEEARLRLANYVSKGSCSGAPLPPIGQQIELVIEARKGRRARPKPETKAAKVARGAAPSRGGFWAVQEVLDVEYVGASAGRSRGRPARRVRVSWCGADDNGQPWEDSWVSWGALRGGGALEQAKAIWQAKRDREERSAVPAEDDRPRRSARLAGVTDAGAATGAPASENDGGSSDDDWACGGEGEASDDSD